MKAKFLELLPKKFQEDCNSERLKQVADKSYMKNHARGEGN